MAFWRSIITLQRDGGAGEDVAVNTLHWDSDRGRDNVDRTLDIASINARVQTLYTALGPLLGEIVGTPTRHRLYDLEDLEPRTALSDVTFAQATATGSLPAEMAVCVTLLADTESGVPRARRRGRVYVGPMDDGTSQYISGAADCIVAATARTTIANAFAAACRDTTNDPVLSVFSRATRAGGGTMDESFNDVQTIRVDDRFDVQRRRGSRPVSFTTATAS